MIDLDGMPEDEIRDIFNQLFFEQRYPAFAGSKVRSEGGWGQIVVPAPFGPEFEGKRVACVGAEYRIIGMNLGNDCCPHFAIGKLVTGAANILYKGVSIAMVGSRGVHADGCGTKSVVVTEGYRKIEMPGESYEFFPM